MRLLHSSAVKGIVEYKVDHEFDIDKIIDFRDRKGMFWDLLLEDAEAVKRFKSLCESGMDPKIAYEKVFS